MENFISTTSYAPYAFPLLNRLAFISIFSRILVTVIAVNMLRTMPRLKVTANPLIGPLPKKNKITAANNVVTFESKIVTKARLNPASIEARRVFPARNSSLNRSKINTLASTAIPMDKMIPAIPGSVSVAFSIFIDTKSNTTYNSRDTFATKPDSR